MQFKKVLPLALLAAVSAPVFAAPIDVTALVTGIGEQATPIGLIGSAVLLIVLAVKAFKWVRAAMS